MEQDNKCARCKEELDPDETFSVLSTADMAIKKYPLEIDVWGDRYNFCKDCIYAIKTVFRIGVK